MHHSNENGGEYGDQSGIMGFRYVVHQSTLLILQSSPEQKTHTLCSLLHRSLFSYAERGGPLMCFNAFRHWEFGWYSSQTRTITGDWTGDLVAFTDALSAPSTDVILKLGDIYMQFNRKKGKNSGTREKADEVVLVQGSKANKPSSVLAGLGSGETYSVNGVTVEVCFINLTGSSYDHARVSIYQDGATSGCTSSTSRGICQDDDSKYFVVDDFVRNCPWVALFGAGNCNESAQHWCKKTCNTCP